MASNPGRSESARVGLADFATDRRPLAFAWLVALVATAGSLYYSLGLGLFPCRLCWYQRICMYPFVVVLGHATLTGQRDVHRVGLPFTAVGLPIAAYHSYLQVAPSATCAFFGCGSVQFRLFGLLTIPNQSLVAFTLIGAVLVRSWWRFRRGGR